MAEIVVNLAIDKLGPLLVQEIKLLRGVRQEIEEVKEELKSIRFFLKGAEKRSAIEELEGNNNSGVQLWVAQVREVTYCIEDVLDEFAFTVAQLPHGRGIVGILRKANRSLKKLKLRHNIVNDIQEIKAKLIKIQDRRKRYGLDSIKKESDVETRNVKRQGGCGVGSYYMEDGQIVGYESIRKELIDLMVNKIPQRRVIVLTEQSGFSRILKEHNMSQCTKTRRLTISESTDNVLKRINDSKVRSLFLSNIVELPQSFMNTISADNFKLMRVLDFEDAPIDYVPERVGNLFHLHYLSLKNTKVKILPKTVGKLLNLETLNLKNTLVGELPVEIKNLKKLRYLAILRSDIHFFSYGEGTNIQESFGSLTDLRKLFGVRLNSKTLEELKKLRQLRVLGVQLVNGNGKDMFSSIANMNYLKTLCIELTNRDETFDIESVASPPKYLERLYLLGNLKKLPDWIFNLQNLARVYLSRSDFTDDPMRVLHSLPNLLQLFLLEAYNGEQLHIKQGWFPKLLELYLSDLKGLKFIMIEDGAMSLLETLVISACPLLKVIPSGVENLRNLSFLHFHNMLMEIESNSNFVTCYWGGVRPPGVTEMEHYEYEMSYPVSTMNFTRISHQLVSMVSRLMYRTYSKLLEKAMAEE
ncbi:hypothetical protein LWI28_011719 [Acer negundo]|uniref:Rx N-terminal domain-containing protein n=1 Tax=Acer negundo TaxID=4023 RepID=A0AAD5NX33_ACENE|nr:hypothetical protein LWI28_011719 [Acer negundo]